jgi:fructose-1,6-bisphosphatase/inositol monophosphatase family enzyme
LRGTDLDGVQQLVRHVAEEVINPRFRALAAGDVTEKSPGEVVTVVDREAEALLTEGLRGLTPGFPVIGEEAASVDPSLLALLEQPGPVWLVDPLDGTPAFVAGSPDHAVMLALVVDGLVVAAVIHQPQHDRMLVAERGSGAYADGRRLRTGPGDAALADLRGGVLRRFLDAPTRAAVDAAHRFGDLTPGTTCAGVEYPLLASGERDFLLFWRTLPWDHAAGSLLVTEAGGVARRLDGSDYAPARAGEGLLVSGSSSLHQRVIAGLGLAKVAAQQRNEPLS